MEREAVTVATKKRKPVKKKGLDDGTESFEDSLVKIEESVVRLESGNLGLADALEEYERGIRSLKQCHQLLERAEQKIALLTGLDTEGNPVSQPYAHDPSTGNDLGSKPSRAGKPRSRSAGKSRSEVQSDDTEDVDEASRLF